MKIRPVHIKQLVAATSASLLLAACASAPTVPEGAVAARANLNRLQADSNLASLARVEIMEANQAVLAAEQQIEDKPLSQHLVTMADTRVEIARAWAQSRRYQNQREDLSAQVEAVRLEARTAEADSARSDARTARSETQSAQAATARAQAATATARREAERAEARTRTARDETTVARTDAAAARSQAEMARTATGEARAETAALQRQIDELNARVTDRGLVMTLGDIMFETGRYELRSGTTDNLDKLATFLARYEDRTVEVEGHTDSTGNAESNRILGKMRADAVVEYLTDQGINRNRLSSSSMGEDRPVASNDSITGRQQNRRVEVIISNEESQ